MYSSFNRSESPLAVVAVIVFISYQSCDVVAAFPQDGRQLYGAHSSFPKLKMASFHCWPWISFPFLIFIRLLTQTPECTFLKSKTNSIRPLYSHQCRHTYHRPTPVCSPLPSTLKSVREPRPESLYPPAHWTRQRGAGFAAHYHFIELITIRILTLNAGWGAGRSSAWIAPSNFCLEQLWRGYWICQAWTLWQGNKVHKVGQVWHS